jgi:hypothetical protein
MSSPNSEHDLETLETWLDGELTDEQAEALRRRLSGEPQLAQALDRLRGDRQTRSRVWQAMEPADGEVEALVANVRRAVRKEELVTSRLRVMSRFAAVAASIAIVFMIGWVSRDRIRVNDPTAAPTQVARGDQPNPRIAILTPTPGNPSNPSNPGGGGMRSVGAGGQPLNPPVSGATFKVAILDPFNNVIGLKELEGVKDAQELAKQFAEFQAAQPEPQK